MLAAFLAVFLLASPSWADALEQVRQRGVLRWGGDQEGGGPYIYPSPDDPEKLIGFEIDLMQALAEHLGVRSEFIQGDWNSLPDLLRRGDIDAVVNGYELTADRQSSMLATIPYYVYELQLLARADDPSIRSWTDLEKASPKKKVAVLRGSAAETYLQKHLEGRVIIEGFDGSTAPMQKVQDGTLDATLQDLPIAIHYRGDFPGLRFVGQPVAPGYYVIYLRPGDASLRDALDEGIRALAASGKLRAIYEQYGLWNASQEELGTPGLGSEVAASARLGGWAVVERNLPVLLQSAGMTVILSCLSMPLAILAGLLIALGRLHGPALVRWPLAVYVEVVRGTPLMLQLYFIFFVLPMLDIRIQAFWAAIIGLAINYSAYEAEIYRAGLLAVPIGQMEAALALGIPRRTALFRIVVPQAVRIVIPPVTNDFIALFKDTSVVSVITVVELTKRYNILANNNTSATLELALVVALLYLMMSYPLSLVARRLERRVPRLAH